MPEETINYTKSFNEQWVIEWWKCHWKSKYANKIILGMKWNTKQLIYNKSSWKGKFVALNVYIKTSERAWINNWLIYLKSLKKP